MKALFVVLSATVFCVSCQSNNSASYLESGKNIAGFASFPAAASTAVSDVKAEAPAEAVVPAQEVASAAEPEVAPAAEAAAPVAETVAADCVKPVTVKSVDAVGQPCATTLSFMKSQGRTDKQIDYVMKASKVKATH